MEIVKQVLENNPLYTTIFTDKDEITIIFVDSKYDIDEIDLLKNFKRTTLIDGMINNKEKEEYKDVKPDVFEQYNRNNIVMKLEVFQNELKLDNKLIEIDDNINNTLIRDLNKEFVEIAEKQGDINRNSIYSLINPDGSSKLDANIKKIMEDSNSQSNLSLLRKVATKLNNISNYIALDGKIGPGKYIISNKKTNEFLSNLYSSSIKFFDLIIDESLKDGKIIMGRKNNINQPGIMLAINKNSFENIVYKDGKSFIDLKYKFSANGYNPEKFYYTAY
jgi:hypothetical protein